MDTEQAYELSKWRNQDWKIDKNYLQPWVSTTAPVIIGGCPRSGSTLLRLIIGANEGVIDGPETHLFLPLPVIPKHLAARFGLSESTIEELLNESKSRAQFIDEFQSLIGTNVRRRWMDKTSRNVHVFAWIADRFPKAHLVHIIRDPRDVVSSLRTHPKYKRGQTERIEVGWVQHWENCIDRWQSCVKDGIKLRGLEKYVEVKYEVLVRDPEGTIRKLCSVLDLEFSPKMLDVAERANKIDERSRAYIVNNWDSISPVTDQAIGRWKRDLPPEQLELISIRLHNQMMLLGYH